MAENRRAKRYPPVSDVQATFASNIEGGYTTIPSTQIYDISETGCCFGVEQSYSTIKRGQIGTLRFQTKSTADDIDSVEIKRTWDNGMAISFRPSPVVKKYCKTEGSQDKSQSVDLNSKNSLASGPKAKGEDGIHKDRHEQSNQATSKLIETNNNVFSSFGQIDYQTVHNEIIDIKACRTNIFTGTLGLLGAAAIAVLTIWGSRESQLWVKWLPFAALIPLFLLSHAILCSIHKARGINKREGYLEILGEYLLRNVAPKYYGGWIKANRLNSVCEMSLPKKTGSQMRGCPNTAELLCCTDVSKQYTQTTDDLSSLRPHLLESFTSLSLYAYSLAYSVCLTIFLISGFYAARAVFKPHFGGGWYLSAIVVGIIPPSIYYIIASIKEWKYRGLVYPSLALIGALIWYFIYTEYASFNDRWYALLAYTLGLAPSTIFGCFGYYLLDKVKSLRRGQYSIERWRHIWQIRFSLTPTRRQDHFSLCKRCKL